MKKILIAVVSIIILLTACTGPAEQNSSSSASSAYSMQEDASFSAGSAPKLLRKTPESEPEPEIELPAPAPKTPAAASIAEPETEPVKSVTVYITDTGKKYHSYGCQYLAKSCHSISLDNAKLSYSPCSKCSPPQ